jgi:uncharacterized protein
VNPAAGPEPTVTVVGKGAATAAHDTALLQLGVETRGATPVEALDGCRDALDRILATLDAAGIEPARRTTGGLDLHEDWTAKEAGKEPIRYRATTTLSVRLADPARAGQVAGAAVTVTWTLAEGPGQGAAGPTPPPRSTRRAVTSAPPTGPATPAPGTDGRSRRSP